MRHQDGSANCTGVYSFSDATLRVSVYRNLIADYCYDDCPVFDECKAGIPSDPFWIIRGGMLNPKYSRHRDSDDDTCIVPGCKADKRPRVTLTGRRPMYCENHSNKSYRNKVPPARLGTIGTEAVAVPN